MENFRSRVSRDQLVGEYLRETTVDELARKYGVSREAVYQRLRTDRDWKHIKTHLRKQRALERLSRLEDKGEQIVDGWKSGVSILDLALEFHTSRKNISNIIKGVLGTTKRKHDRDEEIRLAYKSGITQVELSKRYGISQPCISRIIHTV